MVPSNAMSSAAVGGGLDGTASGPASTNDGPKEAASVVLFESARPQLVMWLGRIMGVKSAVCASAACFSGWVQASAMAQKGTAAVAASSGDARLTAGFLALALASGYVSRAVASRTVTKLVLERRPDAPPRSSEGADGGGRGDKGPGFAPSRAPLKLALEAQDPHDTVVIHRPRLWSSQDVVLRVRRGAIACARGSTTFQGFQLSPDASHGGAVPQYLFPVHGACRSDDLPYLKTMLFGDFFRDEAPPPPDSELIAIEGFGPYRPAQFADAHHPRFPVHLPLTPQVRELPGLPFFTQHGTVWANFSSPPRATLAERRAMERDAKLYGKPATPLARLPATAAPVSLMLDGSHFTHRLTPPDAAGEPAAPAPVEAIEPPAAAAPGDESRAGSSKQ